MRTAIVSLSEIIGPNSYLLDKKVVKEAHEARCLTPKFWIRIKNGEIPYVIDHQKEELREANYKETIRGFQDESIYWMKEETFPEANDIFKRFVQKEKEKQELKIKLDSFKK